MKGERYFEELRIIADQRTAERDYWLDKLSGELEKCNFPYDYKKERDNKTAAAVLRERLNKRLSAALMKLSANSDVRLYIILAAALTLLLEKYTGRRDIIIGTPILKPDVASGTEFTNTVVAIRNRIKDGMSFKELLFAVRQAYEEAVENQYYPLEILIAELGLPFMAGDFPLFDVAIMVENIHERNHLDYIAPGMIFSFSRANEAVACCLEYNANLYDRSSAGRIMNHFKRLLAAILADVEIKISGVDILSQEEKRQLLHEFNDTVTSYPKEKTIYALFAEQVEKKPDSIALVGAMSSATGQRGDGSSLQPVCFTYKQLDRAAGNLAYLLIQKGVAPGTIVALLAERSLEMMVGIFAILKAGGAYLPMEPHSPAARKHYMMKDSNTDLLLASHSLSAEVEKFKISQSEVDKSRELQIETIFIEECRGEPCVRPPGKTILGVQRAVRPKPVTCSLHPVTSPSNLAYIIYTSGTTGKPKGILTMHYNVIRVVKGTNYIDFKSDDKLLQLSNYAFDGSVFDIYGALLNGAALVLVDEETAAAVDKLANLISREKITVFFVTTALFNALVELKIECFGNIRKVLFGGERVSVEHSKKALDYMGKGRILHVYGPTEATVYATYYPIDHIDERDITIPIGRPIANTSLFVLDKDLRPVPTGARGELYIGSDGLARGYMNRPELTAENFLSNQNRSDMSYKSYMSYIYRTGDLVRRNFAGNIEFLGRCDSQVKVRGFRIELGEIENRLLSIPAVEEALVLAKEYKSGDRYLCAYIVADGKVNSEQDSTPAAGELRKHLARSLPDYMVPSYFTFLDKMPLTTNGKIDLKALPEPEARAEGVYVAPRDEVERRMAAIWSAVLGIEEEKIGIDDNFFELGGHSLKATKLVYFIRKEFEISMELKAVFASPCIRELAQIIKAAETKEYKAITAVEEKEYYVMSFAQRRLWVLCQFEEDSTAYNMPGAIVLAGIFNADAFIKAIQALADRHESLRTVFISVAGDPYQKVIKNFKFKLEQIDLRGLDEKIKEEKAREIYLEYANRPFDLQCGPLFYFKLVSLAEEKSLLIHNFHHIINDGWSQGNIYNEIITLYNVFRAGKDNPYPPLQLQYKDYTLWHNNLIISGHFDALRDYWVEKFKDKPNGIELPVDHPRKPLQTFNGGRISFTIDGEVTARLSRLSVAEDVTFFMTLLALVAIFLYKYSGQEDIIIGSPIANRKQPELHPLVGFLVNTLVFRNKVNPGLSFKQFLNDIKRETLECYEYQDYPFDLLVEHLGLDRDLSQSPLFNFMLAHNNAETEDSEMLLEGLKPLPFAYSEDFNMSKFDLVFHMNEFADYIYPSIEYNSDLFDRSTIERMTSNFLVLIDSVLADTDEPISNLNIIPKAEYEEILYRFNDTSYPFPVLTIPQMFTNRVEKSGDKYAVIYQGDKVTYKDLNSKANGLAHYLRRKYHVKPNNIIGISMERSLDMIVVLLGIIKSGAAYLALDPTYPKDRVLHVMNNSRADILITDRMRPELFGSYSGEILIIDACRDAVLRESTENPEPVNQLSDILYVNYTSGSTGMPNGAMLSHDCLANLIQWQNEKTAIDCSLRCLQFTSINFCVSFQEIMGTLTAGGELYLIGDIERQDIDYLLDFLITHQIEILFLPFSYLNFLFNESTRWDQEFDHNLKHIITAGEQLKVTSGLKRFLDLNPHIRLHNHYGSTEMHVVTSYTLDSSTADKTPIPPAGKPVSNVKIYILDDHLNPVPIGVWGELFVAGRSEILGYINNDELNREKLVLHPELSENNQRLYRSGDSGRWLENGNIELRGRKDCLVKVRGFRVELGEIESKLLALDQVRECVVVDREDEAGQKYLVAYLVAEGIEVDEIKRRISRDLPQYMIPKFVFLDSLPLMPNGKVDREKLPGVETGSEFGSLTVEKVAPFLEDSKEIEDLISGEEVLSTVTPLAKVVACYAHLYRQAFSPESIELSGIEADLFPGGEFLSILNRDKEAESSKTVTVLQLFEKQVEKKPDHIAVIELIIDGNSAGEIKNNINKTFCVEPGNPTCVGKRSGTERMAAEGKKVRWQSLTYKEINERAERLAQVINYKGAKPGAVIAILARPSVEMVVSILAVLKTGGTYVIISPGTPWKKAATILKENHITLILSNSRVVENYPYTALKDLSSGKVRWFRSPDRPPITDLDTLPFPDRSLVDYEKYSRYIGITMVKDCMTILSSRGCPYNCAYCHKIWPKKQVCRSAENIFREVELYYNMGVKRFAFIDDIFNLDIKNSSRFFEMVLVQGFEVKFFFSGGLRGDILTPGFIDLMVKAGTVGIAVALETASPRLQKLIGKNLNVEKLRKNLEYICRTHPEVILEMHTMHGFPSETEAEARMTLDFIKSLQWIDFPYIHMVRIYPNTEMERIALQHGVSKEAVLDSEGLAYHEWSATNPFEKSFTQNYQAEFLHDYFLNRERLLHVLPRQMKELTESDMVQKYHSYLPVEIKSLDDLLKFTGIEREKLAVKYCQADDAVQVAGLNRQLKLQFPAAAPGKQALRILLLDLSQYFSADGMLFDVVESPLGLISLLTYLKEHLGSKIHGKIAKARADFDNYARLKTEIEEFQPDVIGIRTLTFYKDFFHRTVAMIRHWGIAAPIIAGGPYASSDYSTILQDAKVDLVVFGEGEVTFLELIENMVKNGGKLPDDKLLRGIPGLVFVPRREGEKRSENNGTREIVMPDQLVPAVVPDGESFEKPEPVERLSRTLQIMYLNSDSGAGQDEERVEVTQAGVQEILSIFAGPADPAAGFLFDGGPYQVFSALCRGAGLIIPPGNLQKSNIRMLEFYKTPHTYVRLLTEKSMGSGTLTGVTVKAPKDELEERLVEIWSEILGTGKEKIGTDANFFELGGHSLHATTLVSRLHKEFDVRVPLVEVFKFPTIGDISKFIKSLEKETFTAIEAVKEKDYYALSSAQKRLYVQQHLQLESKLYNLPAVMLLAGKLEKGKLENVFLGLICRHESLRTSFHQVGGEPVQKIHRPEEIKFAIEYFESPSSVGARRAVPETGRSAAATQNPACQSADQEIDRFIRPFDLAKPPLLRVGLINTGAEEHIFLVDMHHIVTDGTSLGILIREFMAFYSGDELPPLNIQYKDFSEWQNRMFQSPYFKKQEAYWLKQFAGPLPVLKLPADLPKQQPEDTGGRYVLFEIEPQLTSGIKEIVSAAESTLFIVLLAIYTVLLSRYTGQDDIVVGTGTAGRSHADLENVIGFFINMLALRNRPGKEKTFLEFLAEVKQTALDAFANQDYQYEELVRALDLQGNAAGNHLFETILQVQNMDIPELKIPGLTLKPYDYELKTSRHPLTIYATEAGDKINMRMLYSTRIFLPETAEKLAQRFIEVVKQVVEDREIKLQDISLSCELEKLDTRRLREEQGDFEF